ncbi:phage SPO1 DNA polymerase-related protein [Thermocrinis albus DSM 14484]|uniref:Type-4 uracil-DNA glycosylase n=1 Tax=Thermocrinis albus (strain DSM 14484 / JCM 11386 / HI 11/12) TaxID=638303 RepID=D3SLE9_THEAH|nr:uracil-DNA glycosylase [Thermocrinis albus]ADC89579.1 phage SPO1 DNA polymerase-related protein [Thermocrinis albus DSM 14484]
MKEKIYATIKALEEIGFTEIYLLENNQCSEKKMALAELYRTMEAEGRCVRYEGSNGYVLGEGNPCSPVIFVGEAPGEEEDRQRRPFVGRAGQYLNAKLEEVGLRRQDVYITNVVKSRPPGNRTPTAQEIASCVSYLRKEIEIIKPKVIVCLGSTALEGVMGRKMPVTKARGQIFTYPFDSGIKVLLTYHPAYVLRNPSADREFTQDLKKLLEILSSA